MSFINLEENLIHHDRRIEPFLEDGETEKLFIKIQRKTMFKNLFKKFIIFLKF